MDLSGLTGDQLLQLAKSVSNEIADRAIFIQVANSNQWQDSSQRIEDAVRQTQMDDQARGKTVLESKQATIIALLKNLNLFQELKNDPFILNVLSRNNDIRLRVKSKKWECLYYHTGNKWATPRSINAPMLNPEFFPEFRSFASLVCDSAPDGIGCHDADDHKYTIDSILLQQYKEKLCLI